MKSPPLWGLAGEVYRARDTRLKRDVALKILPESFAADPDLDGLVHPSRTHYVPSGDGQRFLISTPAAGQTPTMAITVVLNATAGLKR